MSIFLTAEWRHLAMFNYSIDPKILAPLVPYGTELDLHGGEAYCSIVAFLFLKTRVLRLPIPFHCNFEEVNLRFYVRRQAGGEIRRAVTFVQEVVPRRAIAFLANALYNERYRAGRMSHRVTQRAGVREAAFEWRIDGVRNALAVRAKGPAEPPQPGSLNAFIAEHYWGYAAQKDGSSIEYAVRHPSWSIRPVTDFDLAIDVKSLYGADFVDTLSRPPRSVFLAEGSPVTVSMGQRIRVARSGLSDPLQNKYLPSQRRSH